MSEIELTEEQQVLELARLAGECLENEAFQEIINGIAKDLQGQLNRLEPNDTKDFTVLASKRDLLNQILGHFQTFKAEGEKVKAGIKKDGGLI